MTWQQVTLTLSAADVARAEAILLLAGAASVSLTDDRDDPVLEPLPGAIELWPHVRLSALFDPPVPQARLRTILERALRFDSLSVSKLDESDWIGGLTQAVDAMRIGERLRIVPAEDPTADGSDQIRLNMGLAFGTGRHATTRLCLQWLADTDVRDLTVLDYGCGSGILALAALRLGASSAWATDTETQALTAAAANAALNGFEKRIWLGSPDTLEHVTADLLLANILAGTLRQLAPVFASYQPPGGRVVLSGILAHQADEVVTAFERWYDRFETTERSGWLRLTASRTGASAADTTA